MDRDGDGYLERIELKMILLRRGYKDDSDLE